MLNEPKPDWRGALEVANSEDFDEIMRLVLVKIAITPGESTSARIRAIEMLLGMARKPSRSLENVPDEVLESAYKRTRTILDGFRDDAAAGDLPQYADDSGGGGA